MRGISDIQYAKDQNGQTYRIETFGLNSQYMSLYQYKWGAWLPSVTGYKSDILAEMRRLGLDTDKWYNHQH